MGGNMARKIPGQAPKRANPKRNHSGIRRQPFTAANLSKAESKYAGSKNPMIKFKNMMQNYVISLKVAKACIIFVACFIAKNLGFLLPPCWWLLPDI
jgi:hypothetical protein